MNWPSMAASHVKTSATLRLYEKEKAPGSNTKDIVLVFIRSSPRTLAAT